MLQNAKQVLADRLQSCLAGDLLPQQIGHIENVDGALAKGSDLGRGNVEVQPEQAVGQLEQQADAVEARDLDDSEPI